MRSFIDAIDDEEISHELSNAMHGNGAFQLFKQSLAKHELESEWYQFRKEAYKVLALEWCEENNITVSA